MSHHGVARKLPITLILIFGGFLAVSARGETLPQKIDAKAQEVLTQIKTTSYSHKSVIDAANGSFATDSSGLLDYVLQSVSQPLLSEIKPSGKESRPFAQDYFTAFHASPTTKPTAELTANGVGWERINKVADARPGDVIAWKATSSHDGGPEMGHVLIIDEQPKLEPKQTESKTENVRGAHGRTEQKQVQVPGPDVHRMYRVVVIDSVSTPHSSDTRASGTGGVGRGTVWIDVDSAGEPIGFHWSVEREKPKLEPMAIGRAVSATTKSHTNSSQSSSSGSGSQ